MSTRRVSARSHAAAQDRGQAEQTGGTGRPDEGRATSPVEGHAPRARQWHTPSTTDRIGTPRRRTVRGRTDTRGRGECRSVTASSRNPRRSKTPNCSHKFLFNFGERRGGRLASSNHDEIERAPSVDRARVPIALSENLADAALGAIACHRASHSSGRHDAEAIVAKRVRHGKQGQRSRGDAPSMLLNRRELLARSQPRVGAVRQWHCRGPIAERGALPRKDGSSRKQSGACGPSPGDVSGRCGRSSCACGQGTHGCADDGDGWVERYVSLDSRPGSDTLEKLES